MILKNFLIAIEEKYNYEFKNYALASVERTVVQAMTRMGCDSLEQLHERVLNDTEVFWDLMQSLTIPVSEMFRDPSYFYSIRISVAPHLDTYPNLKVWVAGCSTGEEVYSLAIVLAEEGLLKRTIIYATDINRRSLKAAEEGIYKVIDMEGAAARYQASGGKANLADYYHSLGSCIEFDSELRRSVVFSEHSLDCDTGFQEFQLISCRNVLIYFNRELKERAFGLSDASLCRRGFLGLGAQETMHFSEYASKFDTFAINDRIFQKKSNKGALGNG